MRAHREQGQDDEPWRDRAADERHENPEVLRGRGPPERTVGGHSPEPNPFSERLSCISGTHVVCFTTDESPRGSHGPETEELH